MYKTNNKLFRSGRVLIFMVLLGKTSTFAVYFLLSMKQKHSLVSWLIFLALSCIWGSSFLLMKIGMQSLSPYQVAALRIGSAGIVLLPFVIKGIKQIPYSKLMFVVLSGLLGSFFPAFLFCIAETKIDSALTGILNSLTPLFTVIIGSLFFQLKVSLNKMLGVLIGLIGLIWLVAPNGQISINSLGYPSLVLLATILYAINVNMVGRTLQGIASIDIAAIAFCGLIFPSVFILWYTDYFQLPILQQPYLISTIAASCLGIIGTALASILFYMLLKRSGALFASMVTYGIPFIAVAWGVVYGETVTLVQLGSLSVILVGVYIANINNNKQTQKKEH